MWRGPQGVMSAQVQSCGSHFAAVANRAPVHLASAPDCCLPALTRLSPNSVDSGTEQVFSFKKGSWSPPTEPKETGRTPSYTETSGPCHPSLTARWSLSWCCHLRAPGAGSEAAASAAVVIIRIINKHALTGPSGGRGRPLLLMRIPGKIQ